MTRILALARAELRIAARNRWVLIDVALMGLFSLALAAAGSAPSGASPPVSMASVAEVFSISI